ncbi:unnamed protein product, partial [Heterosigma akashiwo]
MEDLLGWEAAILHRYFATRHHSLILQRWILDRKMHSRFCSILMTTMAPHTILTENAHDHLSIGLSYYIIPPVHIMYMYYL